MDYNKDDSKICHYFRTYRKNPAQLLKKPQSKVFDITDRESKAYTDEEINRIFEVAKKNIEIYTIFRVLHATGMRPGELRALRWKDFNKEDKTISIISAITKEYDTKKDVLNPTKKREIVSSTKSEYSKRTLKLSDAAVEALAKWREHLDNYGTEELRNSQYIFPGPDGNFIKENTYHNKIYRFSRCEELKDIGVTSYRFRHTLCTNLVLKGIPARVILKILGDNTLDLINKVYSHISDNDVNKSLKKLFDSKEYY